LGTLARSALAFGFEMMLVTDKSVELFNPKVVRASAGALFSLPAAHITYDELEKIVNSHHTQIAAAVSPADSSAKGVESLAPLLKSNLQLILAIGAEADGLSDEILNMSDIRVSISHSSDVESLNAAVAGSILMSKIFESEH
jgi:TrmH family RNA methyltransferase